MSSLFEYPFDFDTYIEMRLREIEDLEERKYAKTILVEGLAKIIKKTEEKYKELENRIYEEVEIPSSYYGVYSTIISKEDYDPTNPTFFPVCEEDLKESLLFTIYIQASETKCEELEKEEKYFMGKLKTEDQEYSAKFRLKKAQRYRNKIAQLYELFQSNGIPWTTVHTGHLDKFYDIEFELIEKISSECIWKEVDIDFEEYQALIRYQKLPLWNIEKIFFSSMDFMMPCMDGAYYEHEFFTEEYGSENGYLILKNEDILAIRYEKEKIIIKSEKEVFDKWIAYKIVNQSPKLSLQYSYPILTNQKKENFFRRYLYQSGIKLQTKADLFRRIQELEVENYIEIFDYQIVAQTSSYPVLNDMNWFVKDELFEKETRNILLLLFHVKDANNYLNDTMVRFAVSQIQLEESEYRCVGRIV